jgi:hypothetical protein
MSSNGQIALEARSISPSTSEEKVRSFSNLYIMSNPLSPIMDLPYSIVSIIPFLSSLRVGKRMGAWSNLRLKKISSTLEGRKA